MSSLYSEFDRWCDYMRGREYAERRYLKASTEVLVNLIQALRTVPSALSRGMVSALCQELRRRKAADAA